MAKAIPGSLLGTEVIATAVVEATVSAKPTPLRSIGATKSVQAVVWASKVEDQKAPAAMNRNPTVRTH